MGKNGGRYYQGDLDSLKVTARQFLGENENFIEEKLKKIRNFPPVTNRHFYRDLQ